MYLFLRSSNLILAFVFCFSCCCFFSGFLFFVCLFCYLYRYCALTQPYITWIHGQRISLQHLFSNLLLFKKPFRVQKADFRNSLNATYLLTHCFKLNSIKSLLVFTYLTVFFVKGKRKVAEFMFTETSSKFQLQHVYILWYSRFKVVQNYQKVNSLLVNEQSAVSSADS